MATIEKEEITRFWAEEAERRIDRIDRREVELIPGEEVFEKIRNKYGVSASVPVA